MALDFNRVSKLPCSCTDSATCRWQRPRTSSSSPSRLSDRIRESAMSQVLLALTAEGAGLADGWFSELPKRIPPTATIAAPKATSSHGQTPLGRTFGSVPPSGP